MAAVSSFDSVSAMTQAHQMYVTNNTPAIDGESCFILPLLEATRLFRRPRHHRYLLSIRIRAIIRTDRARNVTPMS